MRVLKADFVRAGVLCLLASLNSACTRREPVITLDLAAVPPDIVSPTSVLRAGEEPTRQLIGDGFRVGEDQTLFVPLGEKAVRFGFYALKSAQSGITIRGASAGDVSAMIEVNGKPGGKITFGSEMADVTTLIPAGLVRAGLNEVVLEFTPGRERWDEPLCRLDSIRFSGAASGPVEKAGAALKQDAGTEISWYLIPHQETLELSSTRSDTAASADVQVLIETEHNEPQVVWSQRFEPGGASALSATVDLGAYDDQPVRCALRFDCDRADATLSWTALRMRSAGRARRDVDVVAATKPNIVIFLVDTLRQDHLPVYGYERPTAPALLEFASDAVVFENAWSQSSWTMPAVASLMTGLYPTTHAIRSHNERLRSDLTTIPEILKEVGYRTAACVVNTGVGARGGFEQGFDVFRYIPRTEAEDAVEQAIAETDRSPFFLYVHLMDVHYPYEPAKPPFDSLVLRPRGVNIRKDALAMSNLIKGRIDPTEAELTYIQSLYDSEIAYVDHAFGRLIGELQRRGQYDNTLIVFMADHGEEFRDHGNFYHGHALYEELTRMALVMRAPGAAKPARVSAPVQTVDLFPTIAGIVGRKVEGAPGSSLMPLLRGEARATGRERLIFSETELGAPQRSIVAGRYKLHLLDRRRGGVADTLRLFDLQEDPDERMNLRRKQPLRAACMAALTRRVYVEARESGAFARGDIERKLDDETRRELEALGYLGEGRQ